MFSNDKYVIWYGLSKHHNCILTLTHFHTQLKHAHCTTIHIHYLQAVLFECPSVLFLDVVISLTCEDPESFAEALLSLTD